MDNVFPDLGCGCLVPSLFCLILFCSSFASKKESLHKAPEMPDAHMLRVLCQHWVYLLFSLVSLNSEAEGPLP